jgi:ATP-dependent protease Clp ATPase subunit
VDNNIERKSCSFCGTRGKKGMRFAGGFGAMICEECVDHYHQLLHSPQQAREAMAPPWDKMSDAEVLSSLPLISRTADQVEEFLIEWVQLARSRKLSWAAIGNVLGTTRQSAWERFAPRMAVIRSSS